MINNSTTPKEITCFNCGETIYSGEILYWNLINNTEVPICTKCNFYGEDQLQYKSANRSS